jgi:hypothetical protein
VIRAMVSSLTALAGAIVTAALRDALAEALRV